MEDLKSFYEFSGGELDAGEQKPDPLPSRAFEKAKGGTPVQKRERLEHQLTLVKESKDKLEDQMKAAKLKDGEAPDSPARLEALAQLIQSFYKKAGVVMVNLFEPLRDRHGNALKEFAMKKLSADEATAQRQREFLEKHVEIAGQYFPGLKLQYIMTKDNEEVAVVLGATAEEFNAVVLAEKTKRLYESRQTEIEQGIKDANAELEKERRTRLEAEKSSTPIADKSLRGESDKLVLH